MLRFVFDTNVLVSAALTPGGKPGRCLAVAMGMGKILLSDPTVLELSDVLLRDKFDRYATRESREAFFVSFVEEKASVIETSERIRACRDPNDDKFLEVGVSGKADYLIMGDQDLLVLHPFRGIPILKPAAFMAEVQKER
ncbi:MAG: putative toxin-antitoxin system toxin component, PIN family [Bacteroidetes bacterium]|nr:putative toxin-antitoxin system toxin component, PIN family [Bacteroidota bacterium]